MTLLEPWERYPDIWKSKASFFTYLRGQLRLTWSRYPAKLQWKSEQLVLPPKGYTGRAKKLGKCSYCKQMFAASNLEVDHKQQAGTCNSWETAQTFFYNLLNCNDNWCLACKPCHKVKSYAERNGTSFDEAKLKKQVIEYLKKDKKFIIEFCLMNGYNEHSLTNSEKRKAAVTEILTRRND